MDSREHHNWTRVGSHNQLPKCGVQIRTESVNMEYSHSWVRISHGLNKLVTDLSNKEYDDDERDTSTTKTEVFALKTDVLAFASRSKDKTKPRRPTSACSSTTRTVPICERIWTENERGTQSNIGSRCVEICLTF